MGGPEKEGVSPEGLPRSGVFPEGGGRLARWGAIDRKEKLVKRKNNDWKKKGGWKETPKRGLLRP